MLSALNLHLYSLLLCVCASARPRIVANYSCEIVGEKVEKETSVHAALSIGPP